MAFGKKYYSSYKSNNNLDYYLEIFVEDYSSTSSELTMGAGGPVIEYETDQEDRFSPIISSSCKIPFLVKDNTDATFIDSLRTTYQERQIYVHLYRSDSSGYSSVSPLWSGFLVMDLGKGVDKSFPYVQELKFVDGLALLKDIDFVDLSNPTYEDRVQGNYVQENMYYGPGTYIFWIREILLKSGAALTTQGATENYRFTTSINWYNGDMNSAGQSDDPLQKTKCQVSMFHRKDDKDVYFPDNCYNVLKELLRHWGARITYWKHQFWIVQIPEYITGESGTLDNPQNNNSRVYTYTGALQGTQDHLGSTYWTRYFQEISNTKISKLTGTTYDYLPIIKQVNADFLSFASENKFGGLPFGSTAPTQEVFQGTINTPSAADFLFLSIPLDWQWDLTNATNFPSGHTNGWWASIKFNFYASDGSTTYYLQYNSSSQTLPYYWVDSANWTPLGNRSPKYTISSKQITVNGHVGFEEQIPFKDANGNAIVMSGAWSFFLDIEDYGTSSQNPGSFYLNFSGYGSPQRMRNPGTAIQVPLGSGNMSGTVSWSNTLQDPQGNVTISSITNPAGFNAGTVANDIRFATTSPFLGLLQLMTNSQSAAYGESYNTMNTSSTAAQENSEQFDFGTLLWGDVTDEFARSSLQVFDGSTYENTNQSGLWGRGTLLGTKTFTQLLIDEFLYGQTKIVITPNMRLAVGEANKDQTQGAVTRPRYVNPIGKLRETRDGADPEYFFRRGSFHTLLDEWDYEGYQILRNVVTTTTQTNGMGNKGGSQANSPNQQAMIQNPVVQALAQNSPIAYLRETVNATGSDVAVNGNFNVATGWTLGTGWTIDTTEKVAKFAATGSTSDLVQSVLTQELTYQVNFRVVVTAGTLTVKAGTSGDTQVISSSGDYSIYLTCEGSNDIKFQAGTTFTGNITFITLRDQKSLSSVPIEEIGSAVFKTGDTFNLINENQDEPLVLTVTADQGSTDTTISVSSTPLYEDITPNSYLLINQDDLSAQYQNKTKGTVGGFDITANSIDSGSVSIESYIDDDTFATASATSLATSESIKAYVDTQVGTADTLQEVTDNGNTTSQPIRLLNATNVNSKFESNTNLYLNADYDSNSGDAYRNIIFENRGVEKMRLTSDGKLGIGLTNPSEKLSVNGNIRVEDEGEIYIQGGTSTRKIVRLDNTSDKGLITLNRADETKVSISSDFNTHGHTYFNGLNTNVGIGTATPSEKLHVVGDILATGDSHADAFKPAVSGNPIKFKNFDSSTEFARITNGGNVLIGSTTDVDEGKLQVFGDINIRNANGSNPTDAGSLYFGETDGVWGTSLYGFRINLDGSANNLQIQGAATSTVKTIISMQRDTGVVTLGYGLTGTTATFSGQVTIPATPVASTDAASKGYVDAQIGANNDLQEVTDNGNTTTNSIMIGSSSSPRAKLTIGGGGHIVGDDNFRIGANTTGDTPTTAIKFHETNGTQQFYCSNSEKMRLTTTGLGIGTTSPSYPLDVVSNSSGNAAKFRVRSTNDFGNINFSSYDGTETLGSIYFDRTGTSIGNLRFYTSSTANTEKMRLTSDGKLGIGTTSPTELLFLKSTGNSVIGIDGNDSSTVGIRIFRDSVEASRIAMSNSADLSFYMGSGVSEKMRLTSNGKLGIGTTSPLSKMHIKDGNTLTSALTNTSLLVEGFSQSIVQVASHSTGYSQIAFGDQDDGFDGGFIYSNASRYLSFEAANTEAMRITSNSNLLIGTTTDSTHKLQVNSGTQNVTSVFKSNDNQAWISVQDDDSGTYGALFGTDTDAGHDIILADKNATKRLVINSSGNVGINTDSPTEKLHVVGDILATGDIHADAFKPAVSGNPIKFKNFDSSTEFARITDGGNLLIGTTTDSAKLTVDETTTNNLTVAHFKHNQGGVISNLLLENSAGANDTGFSFDFRLASSGTSAKIGAIRTNSPGAGDTDMFFSTSTNGTSVAEAMRITSSSNLLIGTTTDNGNKLQIETSNNNDGFRLNYPSTNSTQYPFFIGKSDDSNYVRVNANIIALKRNGATSTLKTEGSSNDLTLQSQRHLIFNTSDANERARITSGGNLLLNTTTDDGSSKLQVEGNVKVGDGYLLSAGSGLDLRLKHDGTDSFIFNETGDLYIQNKVDDKDIVFQCDDGSGGVEEYFRLDGSISSGNPFTVFPDNSHLAFGDSQDLQIDHDGNHSVIYNKTGHLYISNDSNDGDIILRSDNGSGGQTAYITLDGSQTTVNVSQNLLINTTTDVGVPLYVNGVIRAVGGGIQAAQDYGFTLNDESGSNRYGLKFGAAGSVGGSNLLMLTNRSFNSATGGGEVAIGGNTNTTGVTEVEIARFIPRVTATSGTQKKVSLDAVLELTEQTAPADPASGESIIWMDSESGDLKVKINYGGTTVTRTLASFE